MRCKRSDVDQPFVAGRIASKRVLLGVGHVSLLAVSTQAIRQKTGEEDLEPQCGAVRRP